MRFEPTPLAGAFLIRLQEIQDERGYFARSFCRREFLAQGLNPEVAQANISFNLKRGTLRGMHWQSPEEEIKLVRCGRGAIHDVIVDIRPASATFLKSYAVELREGDGLQLYIPGGFAHGFLTLADDTEVLYQMSEFYAPGSSRGARFDDPAFGIVWPFAPLVISDRDLGYAAFG